MNKISGFLYSHLIPIMLLLVHPSLTFQIFLEVIIFAHIREVVPRSKYRSQSQSWFRLDSPKFLLLDGQVKQL